MTLLEISKTQSCVRLHATVCEYREETVSSGNPSSARSLRLLIHPHAQQQGLPAGHLLE